MATKAAIIHKRLEATGEYAQMRLCSDKRDRIVPALTDSWAEVTCQKCKASWQAKAEAKPLAGSPIRKIDKLRALMFVGKWGQALSLAAGWPELGEQRDLIKTAASAQLSPNFYASMGKDPKALVAAGVEALKARYGADLVWCMACGRHEPAGAHDDPEQK